MTNEFEAIKSHHDGLPGPAPEAIARARALLAGEVEAERAGSGHRRPARSPRRPLSAFPGGRWAMRAGVAAGLAVAVTAGLILVRGDRDLAPFGTPPAGAAELLRHAAFVAAREDVRPGPGRFLYIDQKNVTYASGSEGEYTQDVRREIWMPAGDPARALTRSTYGRTRVVSGRDPEHVQSPGTVEYRRAGQCHEGSPGLPPGAADLPADPDRALATIRRDAEAFVRADRRRRGEDDLDRNEIAMRVEKAVGSRLFTLAQNPLTPSRTRATVFAALSRMTTATVVPDLTDPAGRHGVGASLKYETPDGWERGELIFEPGTYRFLGYRSWIGQREGGRVREIESSSMAVTAVKVVDSMPEVPKDAGEPMFC
ncbi:CU044_5270 family protein [Streptosporangium sp. NPDC023615]|uniref:CU044_5270 family protein n=1 Tax=Streptosporangium sp. NPDC023615 TaxID=3154794 RepID=UPI00343DEFD4